MSAPSISEDLKRPQFGNRFLNESSDDVFKHNAWYAKNFKASKILSFFASSRSRTAMLLQQ